MNVSYRWLQSILPALTATPREIADRLATYGAPVDAIVDLGAPLGDIVIGRVLEAKRHPNADRLSLCKVDAGTGEALSVVCGAPNVRAGAFYPFIPAGGTLPGGMTIRRTKIRGEESNGMLCSSKELELGRDHDGILELHGEFTPGARFIEQVGLDDVRFEVDVTPNRPDLLSHWGIARELSPDGEASMRLAPLPGQKGEGPGSTLVFASGALTAGDDRLRITLDDAEGCARYIGAIIRGVRVAPSPEWLASRLRTVGLRPINNVVDATNWVLFELGQPLHGFDLLAAGDTILVRRARSGESLVTLDREKRTLSPDVLLIADAERPLALAGVMGGRDTEVTDDTTDVLLECALFSPPIIRSSRRRLGMSTDASYRFERGVDPDSMERAVRRAVDLICATAGGTPDRSVVVAEGTLAMPAPVHVRAKRVGRLLGVDIDVSAMRALVEPLGFAVIEAAADAMTVRVPGHRRYDVSREVDIVEEIARRRGYDTFPDDVRPYRPSSVPDDVMARLEDRVRDRLVALGFLEARGMPLGPESDGDVPLLHPLASTESHLRRALVPGLVRRIEANFNRGTRNVRLFEIGTAFATGGKDGVPAEATHLAAIFTGTRAPDHWSDEPPAFDLWDLRGLMEEMAALLGLDIVPSPGGGSPPVPLDTPRFTLNTAAADVVGAGGRLAAGAIDSPAWAGDVWAFEITLLASMTAARPIRLQPLPAHPAVDRDVSLVVGTDISARDIEQTIRNAAGALLESVAPFDVYAGEGLPPATRSVAFRMRFRAPDRTLTVGEVDTLMDRILERLKEERNAERRG